MLRYVALRLSPLLVLSVSSLLLQPLLGDISSVCGDLQPGVTSLASPRPGRIAHKSTALLVLLLPRFRGLGSPSTGMIPISWMCGKLPSLATPQNGTVGTKTAVRAEADEELGGLERIRRLARRPA